MKTFLDVFTTWITSKTTYQIKIIDEVCSDLNIDSEKWFSDFLCDNASYYSGVKCFDAILEKFLVHLSRLFEKSLVDYISPNCYNMNGHPCYGIFVENDVKTGFYIEDDDSKAKLLKKIKKLTLNDKEKLMRDKVFSYVVNKTNINIFSKKDIRALKIINLNR